MNLSKWATPAGRPKALVIRTVCAGWDSLMPYMYAPQGGGGGINPMTPGAFWQKHIFGHLGLFQPRYEPN